MAGQLLLCASATRCTAIVLYYVLLAISTPLRLAQAITIARHFSSAFYRLFLVTFVIDMVIFTRFQFKIRTN